MPPWGQVREGSDADVEALTELINAAFVVEQEVFDGNRVDDLGVRAYMSSGTFLVADAPDALAGCVYIQTRGDRSYLGLLSVAPALQGAGLGRQLVRAAEIHASAAGSRFMDLRVISRRGPQLLPFYQRLGYHFVREEPFPPDLIARIPAHYILMSRQLAGSSI